MNCSKSCCGQGAERADDPAAATLAKISLGCIRDRNSPTGFDGLGIAPGDTVMVHASVRAVGEVAGGPDQIHLALKDALTAAGTLMMYASCPAHYDEIGRGNLTRRTRSASCSRSFRPSIR